MQAFGSYVPPAEGFQGEDTAAGRRGQRKDRLARVAVKSSFRGRADTEDLPEDEAFLWLERARDNRDFFLTTLKADPLMDPLRSDARFGALLEQIGIPH